MRQAAKSQVFTFTTGVPIVQAISRIGEPLNKLDYVKQDYNSGRICVGLIVLQTDEVVESEVRIWLPENYTLYHTRIPNQDSITEETVLQMREQLPAACHLLPQYAPIEVIAYCCTSGATVIGESVVEKAVQQIFPNAKVTNPITAIKAYLQHLNIQNIGMLTPYIPAVTQAMSTHLSEHGFNICSQASFYEEHDYNVCRISSESIENAITQVATQAPCDAIFASCTNLRTQGILDGLRDAHKIPVISSNAALAWHIAKLGSS